MAKTYTMNGKGWSSKRPKPKSRPKKAVKRPALKVPRPKAPAPVSRPKGPRSSSVGKSSSKGRAAPLAPGPRQESMTDIANRHRWEIVQAAQSGFTGPQMTALQDRHNWEMVQAAQQQGTYWGTSGGRWPASISAPPGGPPAVAAPMQQRSSWSRPTYTGGRGGGGGSGWTAPTPTQLPYWWNPSLMNWRYGIGR